jgi:redox-sensing transcriptional repressor
VRYDDATPGGVGLQPVRPDGDSSGSERLSLGVAARLSRYLQVLTQAKKMGRETISSQELADYTHVNSTQIRRDLSGFGKFGKRGVGYNVESLVS